MGRGGCGRRASSWTTTGGVLTLVQLDRDPSALRALEPFQRHPAGLAERCQESPTTTTVRLLGAYRLF
jgi:hypothetical protein